MVRTRAVITAAALIATTPLAGCFIGSFAYVGIGPPDDPPSVNLAASPNPASRGETITLVAAASDDYQVVEVTFYRLDVGGTTFLGRDGNAPYALETVIPPGGAGGEVRYLARAVDDAGQVGESQLVSVTVR